MAFLQKYTKGIVLGRYLRFTAQAGGKYIFYSGGRKNMRKAKKSVSALIVALCMLVQLIPAFPVQIAEAFADGSAPYEYTFKSGIVGSSRWTDADLQTHGWEVDSLTTSGDTTSGLEKNLLTSTSDNFWLKGDRGTVDLDNSDTFGLKLNVPVEGYYKVTVRAGSLATHAADVSIYFNGKQLDPFIGNVASATAYAIVPTDVGVVYAQAGTNVMTFTRTGGNYFYFEGITLTPVDEVPAAQTITYSFTKPVGENKTYWDGAVGTLQAQMAWQLNTNLTTQSLYNNMMNAVGNASSNYLLLNNGKIEFKNIGEVLAIDFWVHAPGYYSVVVNNNDYEHYYVYGDTYIDDIPTGDWRGKQSSGTEMHPQNLKAIYLTAGKHTFELSCTGGGNKYLWLREMIITPATVNAISAADVTVSEGNTAETAVTYQTTEGTAVANPIEVKSDSDAIATASYADGKLTVKGVKEGSTTLTLTDVTGITEEVAVTVTEPVPAEKTIRFVADGTNITNAGKAEKATLEINGWRINETETTAGVPLANAKSASVYNTYMGVNNIGIGNSVAYDFEVAAAGNYDVALTINATNYYQGIFDVYINDALVGRIQGDSNGIYTGQPVLGMKTAALNKGVNTVKFTLVGRDTVVSTTEYGAGGGDYYLYPVALKVTPVEQGKKYAQEAVATVVGDTEMGVGGTINVSAVLKYDDSSEEAITVKAYDDGIVSVAADGTVTALKAGASAVYADVTVEGELYEVRVPVIVSGAPSMSGNVAAESDFGTTYAYIENEFNGTYKVTFVGGLDKLEGFAAIGYSISVDGGREVDVEDDKVYKSIKLSDEEIYTADTYGGNFIFIGEQDGITAGQTVTARPYVKDAEGNKTYHGEVVLTLKF